MRKHVIAALAALSFSALAQAEPTTAQITEYQNTFVMYVLKRVPIQDIAVMMQQEFDAYFLVRHDQATNSDELVYQEGDGNQIKYMRIIGVIENK